jgi:hypothetical protein
LDAVLAWLVDDESNVLLLLAEAGGSVPVEENGREPGGVGLQEVRLLGLLEGNRDAAPVGEQHNRVRAGAAGKLHQLADAVREILSKDGFLPWWNGDAVHGRVRFGHIARLRRRGGAQRPPARLYSSMKSIMIAHATGVSMGMIGMLARVPAAEVPGLRTATDAVARLQRDAVLLAVV